MHLSGAGQGPTGVQGHAAGPLQHQHQQQPQTSHGQQHPHQHQHQQQIMYQQQLRIQQQYAAASVGQQPGYFQGGMPYNQMGVYSQQPYMQQQNMGMAQGIQNQGQGLAVPPPPSPVGPRASGPASASANAVLSPVGPSGTGGPTPPAPHAPKRAVLEIIDPSTGQPIVIPSRGVGVGSGSVSTSPGAMVNAVNSPGPNSSGGFRGSGGIKTSSKGFNSPLKGSQAAKEMREKAQAAIKADSHPTTSGGMPSSIGSLGLGATGGKGRKPSGGPAVKAAAAGATIAAAAAVATATAPAPTSTASVAGSMRSDDEKAEAGGVEVSFGSYGDDEVEGNSLLEDVGEGSSGEKSMVGAEENKKAEGAQKAEVKAAAATAAGAKARAEEEVKETAVVKESAAEETHVVAAAVEVEAKAVVEAAVEVEAAAAKAVSKKEVKAEGIAETAGTPDVGGEVSADMDGDAIVGSGGKEGDSKADGRVDAKASGTKSNLEEGEIPSSMSAAAKPLRRAGSSLASGTAAPRSLSSLPVKVLASEERSTLSEVPTSDSWENIDSTPVVV
ncbi:unnamed protein product, partial [Choristocarpus tenellus]